MMDSGKTVSKASFGGMAREPEGKDSQQALRLRALREAIGIENGRQFAAQMGIEYKRWNNFERGHPLSKDAAFILVKRIPGLTLDWLFFGKTEGLTVQLARRLEAKSAEIRRAG